MKKQLSLIIIFFTTILIQNGCQKDDDKGSRYTKLVWQDEFDGEGSIDANKWNFDIGNGAEVGLPGWGNNELQYYSDRSENIQIKDGKLEITARKEAYNGSSYTSAKIHTKGIFQTTFGRFEARIKLPFGQGLWPAFWLLGDDSNGTVIWPAIGEIDIMEYRGQQPTIIHGTIHGPGYSGGNGVTDSYALSSGRFDSDFYIFAVEWGTDYIEYYVNDILYNRITPKDANGDWVFNDNEFYIILNMAVGGTFLGPPNESTPFPQTMYIDYVRVFSE